VTVVGRTPEMAASGVRHHRSWYRHRAVLVAGGLAAVVAIAVLTDLPTHASRSVEIAGDKSVISQVNADVGPCSFALGESLTVYGDLTARTLSAADAARIPGLLHDDQTACSFVDDSIYQLSTIEVPGSTAGNDLGQLVNSVTLWATSDALSAIEQIQILYSHPSDASARGRLAQDEQMLRRDRGLAQAELDAADKALGTRLPALHLAQAPG